MFEIPENRQVKRISMSQSAYIKLVEGSAAPSVTLDEVKQYLQDYIEQTKQTGKQLGWDYAGAAFPYTFESRPDGEGKWFYLKGTNPLYKYMIFGVGKETGENGETHYIQVVLPDGCTHGDKSKGNELCKYLGKKLKAEVHMFNGRVMYFNPRK